MNLILMIGSLLGFTSVFMAAYVDHSLALQCTGKILEGVLTAVRYHQLYAVIITMLGFAQLSTANKNLKIWTARSAWVFITGSVLFCFSIYLAAMTGWREITFLTPIGGVMLMAGWLILLRAALFPKSLAI